MYNLVIKGISLFGLMVLFVHGGELKEIEIHKKGSLSDKRDYELVARFASAAKEAATPLELELTIAGVKTSIPEKRGVI
jgi:hypothetical protein